MDAMCVPCSAGVFSGGRGPHVGAALLHCCWICRPSTQVGAPGPGLCCAVCQPGVGVGGEAERRRSSTGGLHGNRQPPPGQEPAPGKSVTRQFLAMVRPLLCVSLGSGGAVGLTGVVPAPQSWPAAPALPRMAGAALQVWLPLPAEHSWPAHCTVPCWWQQ